MPLDQIRLGNTIETGIRFESLPGCIPVFTEVNACIAAGYRYFHDWQELEADQQSFLIAHYLSNIWVDAHKADAEAQEIWRKSQLKG